MLHVIKRLAAFLAVGGVIGDIATMLLAPSFITWFHTPGVGSALCNCADVAKETAGALINAQLIGTGVGAVVGAVVGELTARLWDARKKRRALAAPHAPAPLPAPDAAASVPAATTNAGDAADATRPSDAADATRANDAER